MNKEIEPALEMDSHRRINGKPLVGDKLLPKQIDDGKQHKNALKRYQEASEDVEYNFGHESAANSGAFLPKSDNVSQKSPRLANQ